MYSYTAGNVADNYPAHAPFGESYPIAGYPSDFTGQQNDQITSNTTYYFPERQYRSSQGRWLSPDPAGLGVVDPGNPQSWNRYAYVTNNPLGFVDPLGLGECVWDNRVHDCPDAPGDSPGVLLLKGECQLDGVPVDCHSYWLLRQGDATHLAMWRHGELQYFTDNSALLFWLRGAANNATIQQGNKQFWKDYCSHQSNLAALEALLPGITQGNYVSTASKMATEVGAHTGLEAAAGSTALKYAIRSQTGIPMSITSKFLGYLAGGLLVYSGYEAYDAMVSEYQACINYERVNVPEPAVVQAAP
jgi:RHS repeat-associated protein